MLIRNVFICSLSAALIFSTLLNKLHDFPRQCSKRKIFPYIFSTNYVFNISHIQKNGAKYHQIYVMDFK
jgi:hypothetical protein